jgi:hypothetical protein
MPVLLRDDVIDPIQLAAAAAAGAKMALLSVALVGADGLAPLVAEAVRPLRFELRSLACAQPLDVRAAPCADPTDARLPVRTEPARAGVGRAGGHGGGD